MNYALIDNNIVSNIIYLYHNNANEFPNAVLINNISVNIGDEYIDGVFYRNGERILTRSELMQNTIAEKEAIIAELDAALLEITYANIIGGLE